MISHHDGFIVLAPTKPAATQPPGGGLLCLPGQIVELTPMSALIMWRCSPTREAKVTLECAPSGGHLAGLELTRTAGLSEDESHGQAPLPQHPVQTTSRPGI